MQILRAGIQKYPGGDVGPSRGPGLWVQMEPVEAPVALCVNSEIMNDTVRSEDRSTLTVELPDSLVSASGTLEVKVLDLYSGRCSNELVVEVEPGPDLTGAEKRKGNHILISCFPKSGSTFLLRRLEEATGYINQPMVFEYGGNEQDLYLPAVTRAFYQNTVTQQHLRATGTNIRILADFDFRVVVLTRNIPDTLVSLHDHLLRESLETPLLHVDSGFEKLDFERRLDMLIDLALPWYLNFYASWFNNYTRLKSGAVMWVDYEQVVGASAATVAKICQQFGLPFSIATASVPNLDDPVTAQKIRFNVGRPGRGRALLSPSQLSRISALARHHPRVDFSRII